jgi:hypothetical protein
MTNPVTPESANSFVAFFADDRTLEARDRTPEAERLEEFPYLDHSLIELESALPGNSPRAVGPRVLVRQGGEFEC